MHPSQVQQPTHKKFQRHAFLVKRKLTAAIAFSTTLMLLCIENVKAFTTSGNSNSSFSSSLATSAILNENTMLFFASGAHSLAQRWRLSQRTNRVEAKVSLNHQNQHLQQKLFLASPTSLKMAFGFDSSPSSPELLDMKTSISAFGGWYNTMDPVARPPIYDDDAVDFSLLSPSDNWPTSFEDDGLLLASLSTRSKSVTAATASTKTPSGGGNRPRRGKTPRPVRTIRRIAGWVVNGSTRAVNRTFL